MKIIIRAKNIALTKELQSFIEEKVSGLKKFADVLKKEENKRTFAEVFVDIERETKHHKKGKIFRGKAIIALPGREIVAATRGDDLTSLVVKIKDELQQEIKKYKEKIIDSYRRRKRKERV